MHTDVLMSYGNATCMSLLCVVLMNTCKDAMVIDTDRPKDYIIPDTKMLHVTLVIKCY